MNVLTSALCCLLLASAAAGASLRIAGGDDAPEETLTYQVALLEGEVFLCSGAILSKTWVITSAKCIDGKKTEIEVRAGVVDLDDKSLSKQSILTAAADRTIHPHFEPQFLDNDIALIKLTTPLMINFQYVREIGLPTYADAAKDLAGVSVVISGWGRTGDSASLPDSSKTLKIAEVGLSANSVCEKVYGNKVIGTKTCLETATSNVSPCLGDAGSPVAHNRLNKAYLYGIVSFGFEDGCEVGKPVVFTRVSSFLEFIGTTTDITILD